LLAIARSFRVGPNELQINVTLDNAFCHEAMERAAAVFARWPAAFRELCKRVLGERAGPEMVYRLDALAECDETAFLRVALDEDLAKQARASPLVDLGTVEPRFVTPDDTRRRLGLNGPGLERLLASRRVRVVRGAIDPHALLVDLRSVDALLAEREWMLTTTAAAAALGVAAHHIPDLVRHTVLEPASGPDVDGLRDVRFERGQVVDLFNAFARRARPARETVLSVHLSDELVATGRVLDELRRAGRSAGRWLRRVLDGEVVPFELLPHGAGSRGNFSLGWFAFDRREIEPFVATARVRAPPPHEQPSRRDCPPPVAPLAVAFLRMKGASQHGASRRAGERTRSVGDLALAATYVFSRADSDAARECQLMRES